MNYPVLPQPSAPAEPLCPSVPLRVALVEADFPVPSPVRGMIARLDSVVLVDPGDSPSPHALVVDLGRDSRGGCALVRAMASAFPGAPILAVVSANDPRAVGAALGSGARACLVGSSASELLRACLDAIRSTVSGSRTAPSAVAPELSKRELDVLHGMAKGRTYRQIAQVLSISPHTVHTHVRKLYEKLEARCRQDAVEAAHRLGLLDPSAR